MRLNWRDSEHRLPQRVLTRLIRRSAGTVPDVVRTVAHRPELFGRSFARAVQDALRGPSDWTPWERELFAAFVSRRNQCPF